MTRLQQNLHLAGQQNLHLAGQQNLHLAGQQPAGTGALQLALMYALTHSTRASAERARARRRGGLERGLDG